MGRTGLCGRAGGIVEGQGRRGCVAVETWEGEEDRGREGGGAAGGFSGIVKRGWVGGNVCFSACEGTATFSTIPFLRLHIFIRGASRWDGYGIRR